jgi:hypothetical protein
MNLFLLIIILLLSSCGKNNINSKIPQINVEKSKVYFTTNDYKNRIGYLYSFNSITQEVNQEPVLLAGVDGLNNFQLRNENGDIDNLYITKFIFNQPSKVLIYKKNSLQQETAYTLPQNIYDVMYENNNLYFLGYDKKELAITSSNSNSLVSSSKTISPFDSELVSDPNNFSAILKNKNKIFILNVGVGYLPFKITGSFINQLDSNNTQIETSFPIVDKETNIMCYDINSFVKLSNNKIILACNPRSGYLNINVTPALFLVDVSSTIPFVKLLQTSNIMNDFIVGGVSKEKDSVFITEEIYDSNKYPNLEVAQSYWININSFPQVKKIMNNQSAYYVTFDNTSQNYIYSCFLDDNKTCKKNTFGISSDKVNSNVKPVYLSGLSNINSSQSISFFKEL